MSNVKKESRIQETLNISPCEDSSTNTKRTKINLVNHLTNFSHLESIFSGLYFKQLGTVISPKWFDWGSNVIPPDFIRLFIRFEGEGGGFPPNFITDSSLALYKICGQDVMTNALLFYPSLNKSYIRHNIVVCSSCV